MDAGGPVHHLPCNQKHFLEQEGCIMVVKPNRAEIAANVDFKGVIDFVDALADAEASPDVGVFLYGAQSQDGDAHKKQILDRLRGSFKLIAKYYFELGERAIQNGPPENKAYYNAQVISHLVEHVQLLNSMSQSSALASVDRWPLIRKVIDAISTRFEPKPILVPVISTQFEYVHFNYMENVAVINVPLNIWSTPSRSLSILWHEVAGYSVARARRNDDLKHCASDLASRLHRKGLEESYRKWFLRSALERVTVRVNLNQTYPTIDAPSEFRKRLMAEVNGTDWQLDWLGEFVEDLFIAQAFEERALEMLALALMRRYEAADLGDATHPSPGSRLQVVLEYLYLRCQDKRDKIEEIKDKAQSVKANFPSLAHLEINPDEPGSELKEIAGIIAQLYLDHINEFSKKKIAPQEQQVVKQILEVLDDQEQSGLIEGGENLLRKFARTQEKLSPGIAAPPEDTPVLPRPSKYIWLSAGLNDDYVKEVRDEQGVLVAYKYDGDIDLKTLQKIVVAEIDQTGPELGAWPPR